MASVWNGLRIIHASCAKPGYAMRPIAICPSVGAALLLLGAFLTTGARAVSQTDPYAWLEEVHGTRPLAWVAEQNARSRGILKADPAYQKNYDSILSVLDASDRIAYGAFRRDGMIYNFWQDAANPKGVWRRTAMADYRTASPHWETVLDIDALARTEKENWVWEGTECAPAGKPYCLIKLSRGGGDAKVIREFDLEARSFVKDGFSLPEAKSDVSYVNGDDAILYASDFGPGSLTKSGYPRIVKFWKRGDPAAGHTVYEGKPEDVGVSPAALGDPGLGQVALIVRSVSFSRPNIMAWGRGRNRQAAAAAGRRCQGRGGGDGCQGGDAAPVDRDLARKLDATRRQGNSKRRAVCRAHRGQQASRSVQTVGAVCARPAPEH